MTEENSKSNDKGREVESDKLKTIKLLYFVKCLLKHIINKEENVQTINRSKCGFCHLHGEISYNVLTKETQYFGRPRRVDREVRSSRPAWPRW